MAGEIKSRLNEISNTIKKFGNRPKAEEGVNTASGKNGEVMPIDLLLGISCLLCGKKVNLNNAQQLFNDPKSSPLAQALGTFNNIFGGNGSYEFIFDEDKSKEHIKSSIEESIQSIIKAYDTSNDKSIFCTIINQLNTIIDTISGGKAKTYKVPKEGKININADIDKNGLEILKDILESLSTPNKFDKEMIDNNISIMIDILDPKKGKFTELIKCINDQIPLIKTIESNMEALHEAINKIPSLFSLIVAALKIELINKQIITGLGEVMVNLEGVKVSETTINNLQTLSEALEVMNRAVDAVNKVSKMAKEVATIGQLAKILAIGVKALGDMIDGLDKHIFQRINEIDIDEKKLKQLYDATKQIMSIVIDAAKILLIAGLAMLIINPIDILMFAATLAGFIWAITSIFNSFGENLDKTFKSAEGIATLVAMAGLILILGGAVMSFINPGNLILFGLILSAFIFGVMFAVIGSIMLVGSLFGFADYTATIMGVLDAVEKIAFLVYVCGMVLLIGGFVAKSIDFGSLTLFSLILALFIGLTITAILAPIMVAGLLIGTKGDVTDTMTKLMSILNSVALFVVGCGLIMILAGLATKIIDTTALFWFALTLAGFMFAVIGTLVFFKSSGMLDMAKFSAKEFIKLLIGVSLVMIFGGLFFKYFPGLIPGLVLFTVILSGFLLAIGFSMKLAGEIVKTSKNAILQMTMLIVLTGAILLFAGYILVKHPAIALGAIGFAILNVIFYGIMIGAVKLLSILPKGTMFNALIAVGLIGIITLLSVFVFNIVDDFGKKFKWADLFQGIGAILSALLTLGLGYVGLGYLSFLDGGLGLTLATVSLGIINGLTLLTIFTLHKVFEANKESKKNPNALKDFGLIIKGFVEMIANAAVQFGSIPIRDILKINFVAITMSIALAAIATSVKYYASLTIPEYEGKKIVRYRKLEAKDFRDAARNVTLIISTLGNAILKTYEKNPELFDSTGFLGLGSTPFAKVCVSLQKMGPMLERIAKAVKNYASLTIPEYEGTKVVSYRKLDSKDFIDAAKNVKTIISVLGGAIIKAYSEHPDYYEGGGGGWFSSGSPFAQTVTSNMRLADLITKIARAVKDYANLTVAETYDYNDKTGKLNVSGVRTLNPQDFVNAATNVTTIMSILGNAIIDVYSAHPDYYKGGGGNWFSNGSPFAQTISANMKLANLITKIAGAVKDYANLTIYEDYKFDEKSGKLLAQNARHLDNKDFTNAATNVKLILDTLGGAIIDLYEEHKGDGLYEEGIFTDSPFYKVIKANMKLGNLITKIAGAIKDYANMTVVDYVVKDNEIVPNEVRHLDPKDFNDASANIKLILCTLGKTIVELKKNDKEGIYESSWISGSPFVDVVEANMKLANLITKIGGAVKDYANLTVTEYEVKDGQIVPKAIRHLERSDFISAKKNISEIISTLGQSIMDTYKTNEDWFEDGEDSDFAMVCSAIGTMGTMISNIAAGLQNYANLTFPDYSAPLDEKTGKPTKYLQMDSITFSDAARNIGIVISTLGQSLIEFYNQNPDWFDDGEDSIFMIVSNATAKMGEMLANVSTALQNYASLNIPIKWDAEGKPIDYKQLTNQEMIDAGINVGQIISTLGGSIMNLYYGKDIDGNNLQIGSLTSAQIQKMFEYDEDDNDSPFNRVLNSCILMGDMIASIAEGIKSYASGFVPNKWDSNGKPTDYIKLEDSDYIKAGVVIGLVISSIGEGIMTAFNEHQSWFEPTKYGGLGLGVESLGLNMSLGQKIDDKTPFDRVLDSCIRMSDVIAAIADGIAHYAGSYVPEIKDGKKTGNWIHIGDEKFNSAGEKIGQIITSIGEAIMGVFDTHQSWFENPTQISLAGGFAGVFFGAGVDVKPAPGDSPFERVIKCVGQFGKIIATLADGIVKFSTSQIPDPTNPTKMIHLTNTDFKTSSDTIGKIVTNIGDALMKVYNEKRNTWFNNDAPIFKVLKVANLMGVMLSSLSKAIYNYSTNYIPIVPEGGAKVEDISKLPVRRMDNSDYIKASMTIQTVITTIAESINKAAALPYFKDSSNLNLVTKVIGDAAAAVSAIGTTISNFAFMVMPDELDTTTGKIKSWKQMKPEDFENAGKNIGKVITGIIDAIKDSIDNNANMQTALGGSFMDIIKANMINAPIMKVIESIIKLAAPIKTLSDVIIGFAGGAIIKEEFDENGKVTRRETSNISQTDIEKGKQMLESIITALPEKLSEIYEKYKDSLRKNMNGESMADIIVKNIEAIVNLAQNTAINIETIINNADKIIKAFDKFNSNTWKDLVIGTDDKESKISILFNGFRNCMDAINNFDTSDEQSTKLFAVDTTVNKFVDIINQIIELSENAEGVDDVYNKLAKAIHTIDNSIQSVQENQNFENHQKQLDKYVKAVNRIDLTKLNRLNTFVMSVNLLSRRLGNIDKLTDAIADRLSVELQYLTKELKKAAAIINTAEEIQKKREESIISTVSKVNSMLKQDLTINVKQVNDLSTLPPGDNQGGGGEEPSKDNGKPGSQGNPPPGSSPEDKLTDKKSDKLGKSTKSGKQSVGNTSNTQSKVSRGGGKGTTLQGHFTLDNHTIDIELHG